MIIINQTIKYFVELGLEQRSQKTAEGKTKPMHFNLLFLLVVLVLAGIELVFFLVAGIVLCVGFRMKIMLITH